MESTGVYRKPLYNIMKKDLEKVYLVMLQTNTKLQTDEI